MPLPVRASALERAHRARARGVTRERLGAHRAINAVAAAFLVLAAGVSLVAWPFGEAPLIALLALVTGAALAIHGAGVRSVLAAHVGLCAFGFIIAPVVTGHSVDSMGAPWTLVALWFLGWSAGQYFSSTVRSAQRRGHWIRVPRSFGEVSFVAVLVVGVVSLFVQWVLLQRAQIGYAAQIRGFTSTGPLALVASVGPVALATAYVMCRIEDNSSLSRRVITCVLVGLQGLALATTGFRGGGPLYLIAIWLVRKRWRPGRRMTTRGLVVAGAVGVAILALFSISAQLRTQQADLAGVSSAGTRASPLAAVPRVVTERFDFLVPMHAALERSSWPRAKQAVSPSAQLISFVPRQLWLGKPTIDYGHQVAQAFFDIPAKYPTSASITWIGDLYVQGGRWAVLLAGLGLGFVIRRWLRRTARADALGIAAYFLLVQALLSVESPILITAASALRSMFVFVGGVVLTSILLRTQRTNGLTPTIATSAPATATGGSSERPT